MRNVTDYRPRGLGAFRPCASALSQNVESGVSYAVSCSKEGRRVIRPPSRRGQALTDTVLPVDVVDVELELASILRIEV